MNVLITGAGGAIGIHLLVHLMENTDWKVTCIDSFRHKGYYDRLTTLIDRDDWLERIVVLKHDLTAPLTDRQIAKIGKIDHLLNLASLSDVAASVDDPVSTIRNNVELTLNVLEYARKVEPTTFVQFSTDEVYGATAKDSGGHKEWDTILPSNPYSASKAAQEAIAIAYWRTYGVPVIITNTMNNFGETQAPSKYPAMIQTKLHKGEKIQVHSSGDGQIGSRYYLHSRNASDAVLFILKETTPYQHKAGFVDKPDRYNIVGDVQLDNLELAQEIAKLMGKKLDYELVDFHSEQPGHDLHYGLNGAKMKKLGWTPPMTFEDSLKNTIDWQEKHKDWMK